MSNIFRSKRGVKKNDHKDPLQLSGTTVELKAVFSTPFMVLFGEGIYNLRFMEAG